MCLSPSCLPFHHQGLAGGMKVAAMPAGDRKDKQKNRYLYPVMNALIIFAVILGVLGIVGSIAPGLPGPPLGWIGLLLIYFAGGCSPTLLFTWLGITTAVTVLDYIVPAWLTKATGGHKAASWGAIIGLFAGIFLTPIGMLAGSLLGAFIGELLFAKNDAEGSLKAAAGAFLGFILGTGLKLAASGMMLFYIVRAIIRMP